VLTMSLGEKTVRIEISRKALLLETILDELFFPMLEAHGFDGVGVAKQYYGEEE